MKKGKQMKRISRTKIKSLIDNTNGRVFSIVFKKKDGTKRKMLAKMGVKHNLKGGKNNVEKLDNDYITTFDIEAFDYRTINLATVQRLKIDREIYKVV